MGWFRTVYYCSGQGCCPGCAYEVVQWLSDQAVLTLWGWHLPTLLTPWISFWDLSNFSTTDPTTVISCHIPVGNFVLHKGLSLGRCRLCDYSNWKKKKKKLSDISALITCLRHLVSYDPMLKCDDRFARQNRGGPPPEFPLASPSSSIAHHLSGPIGRAQTETVRNRPLSVDYAPPILRWVVLVSGFTFVEPLCYDLPRTRAHVRLLTQFMQLRL